MSWRKARATGLPLTAAALAARLEATVEGDGAGLVTGVCAFEAPQPGCVAFLEKPPRGPLPAGLAALLAPPGLALPGCAIPVLRTANPRRAFARALEHFYPEPQPAPGVHPAAVVEPGAVLGRDVHVGPGAVVYRGASIGDDAVLHAGAVVGEGAAVGDGSVLFPNVVVYPGCRIGRRVRIHAGTVIGSDGFGYIWDGAAHYKIPQVGTVLVEDEVEIGANCTVDCGTVGPTVIRRGAKIDNLVHLAHNVEVGAFAVLVGQVGVSGSSRIGAGATLGGQVGVAGHLTIGERATIAAKSGVTKDVPAGQLMSGFPLRPHAEEKRIKAVTARLPELLRRLIAVERKLGLEPGPGAAEEK